MVLVKALIFVLIIVIRFFVDTAKKDEKKTPSPPREDSRGIRWMSDVYVQAGDCQVCGDVMNESVIHCPKCGTPHHRDCWSWARKCSTYGCGQAA